MTFKCKLFLALWALVHAPLLAYLVPVLMIVMFLPLLFVINVPGIPLGMLLGQPFFEFREFGVIPLRPYSWILIELCWLLIISVTTDLVNSARKQNSH